LRTPPLGQRPPMAPLDRHVPRLAPRHRPLSRGPAHHRPHLPRRPPLRRHALVAIGVTRVEGKTGGRCPRSCSSFRLHPSSSAPRGVKLLVMLKAISLVSLLLMIVAIVWLLMSDW